MATTLTQPARRFTDRSPKSMNQSSSARRNTDKIPKVVHHQPPKSLVPKKNPGRASELETQITLLQEDLTRTKEQLASTETQKRRTQQELEEAKNHLSILSSKYEDLHCKNVNLSASEDDRIKELRQLSKERDRAWQSELDALKNQHALDLAALSFASKEIQRLRMHLSKVIESESVYADESEVANSELVELKQEMGRTFSTVENLKIQLRESEQAKAKAEAMADETQHQLEIAKSTVDTLLSDGSALMESFNSVVSELEKSRAQENLLKETIKKLQEELALELESTHVKYQEEEIRNMVLILSAYELEESLRNKSISQEANLQSALKDTQAEITALKAKLSEKDAHIRSVSEINKRLQSQIKERVGEIKSSLGSKLMDKETELQGIMQENKLLKSKIKEREEKDKNSEVLIAELDLVRDKEQEATMKFVIAKEELEINSRMAEKLSIQLDEALAVKEETESELKRLRVQSEQWRKAAETAMAVLRTGKEGDFLEKLMSSPFSDNLDDESVKTRNPNVLRWMGELWKKGQK